MYGIETIKELKLSVHKFIKYYNTKRLHSVHDYKTPMSVFELSVVENKKELFQFIYEYNNEKSVA